jgi:hypothetical protein
VQGICTPPERGVHGSRVAGTGLFDGGGKVTKRLNGHWNKFFSAGLDEIVQWDSSTGRFGFRKRDEPELTGQIHNIVLDQSGYSGPLGKYVR